MSSTQKQRILQNLQTEIDGITLYNTLASIEKDERIAEVYRRMAAVEKRHVEVFSNQLKGLGEPVPELQPTWRTRILVWLAKRFGSSAVLPSILGLEKDAQAMLDQPEEIQVAAEEGSHARVLRQISRSMPGGMQGGALAQIEGRHRGAGGNALRAAVLGANDGLVSNLSLVMGVAGADLSGNAILVTGLAGLLAGASSMALGEWLSVQSSRELYQHQIGIEKAEISANPQEEAEELALIYEARGVDPQQARLLAQQVMQDQDSALETLAREELSVNPEELGGSAWEAAITSFILFALGAIVPVAPFMFLSGTSAILTSILFSTLGLFIIGAGITLFTGRSVWFSGARQVLFGLAAAALTFSIGRLIGVNLGG
jgi:VIT1/CCC1 family predicted Fe2+/Mn2+ transporter